MANSAVRSRCCFRKNDEKEEINGIRVMIEDESTFTGHLTARSSFVRMQMFGINNTRTNRRGTGLSVSKASNCMVHRSLVWFGLVWLLSEVWRINFQREKLQGE